MTVRTTPAALAGVALAAAGALFVFDPAVTSWFPSCPLNTLTGWLCPFCGSLRAVHALLHGHIEAALRLNPMTTAGVAIAWGPVFPVQVGSHVADPQPAFGKTISPPSPPVM